MATFKFYFIASFHVFIASTIEGVACSSLKLKQLELYEPPYVVLGQTKVGEMREVPHDNVEGQNS